MISSSGGFYPIVFPLFRMFYSFLIYVENFFEKNLKIVLTITLIRIYNRTCVAGQVMNKTLPNGVWLSLVERLVWDQEVAGSNPVTPI